MDDSLYKAARAFSIIASFWLFLEKSQLKV
jgi:hypothetical protein